jgi:hypothetical protein
MNDPIRIRLLLARRELELKLERGEDGRGAQLLTPHPEADDAEAKRQRVAERHGMAPPPTRGETPATIDIPLDTREQTVLSYRLDAQQRATLAGGVAPPPNRGRKRE